MASYFKSLSDDMEKVAQVLEDGYQILSGAATQMGEASSSNIHAADSTAADFDGDEDINLEDFEEYGSPLMGMADSVMSDIMSYQVGPQTPTEQIQAFKAAITWSEPFIQCLLAFQAVVIITAIALTKKGGLYTRMGFMIILAIIVRLAERLNVMGNSRWKEFATQNYFDRGGIFIGIMLCAPLLCVCFGMLFAMFREANTLLVDVKAMKIKAQQEQQQKKKKSKEEEKKRRKKKD
ncbi:transmembrane protein 18 [Skeletonema marinoi]|uniref:Transmembrane protein 18 n=1 Tax=Skeletonema marinoi TaxID=267567 RepID=A0AAD8YFM9_9STRA|nr:transmembrane protein 18 [Skeletonema marinoi]|mmetsp:Transcript_25733/g.51567  ORF Transcript_25733/g.51567 Transcript_25733/m.51567 type:complete len:236 (-) Transcript_25733:72-779(-)